MRDYEIISRGIRHIELVLSLYLQGYEHEDMQDNEELMDEITEELEVTKQTRFKRKTNVRGNK